MSEGAETVQPFLRPGERVLWTGRPDPAVIFTGADAFLVPFSLLWGGFAIVWEVLAIRKHSPFFFDIFGGVFVLFGLYFIAGRFFYKRYRKAHTAYALTDRRAIAVYGTGSLDDTPVAGLPTNVRRSRDGRHVSVTIGAAPGGWGNNRSMPANTEMDWMNFRSAPQFGFYDVADPDGLLRALDQVSR